MTIQCVVKNISDKNVNGNTIKYNPYYNFNQYNWKLYETEERVDKNYKVEVFWSKTGNNSSNEC